MSYWTRRAENRLLEAEEITEKVIRQNIRNYNRAMQDIRREIDKIFETYSTRTGVNYRDLKKLMSGNETKDFYKNIEKRINAVTNDNVKTRLLMRQDAKAYKTRISRLEAIREEIYIRTKELGSQEAQTASNHLSNVTKETYNRSIYDTAKQRGVDFNFSKISDTKMKELMRVRWSGSNYSENIWNNTTKLANKLNSTITRGFLVGKPQTAMVNEIREIFEVGKYEATRLIRTETNYFANQGELLSYEEMGVEKYQFLATLDHRTSDICGQIDGKRYKLDKAEVGVNYPPMHPNCRSTTAVPISDVKGLKRRAVDKDGKPIKVPINMTYKGWKKKHGIT